MLGDFFAEGRVMHATAPAPAHAALACFLPTPPQASEFLAHHLMVLKHKGLIQILWKQAHALDGGEASQEVGEGRPSGAMLSGFHAW